MQHLPTIEVLERAIRSRVCTICFKRPPGSEGLGPGTPRLCEIQCTIFQNLPVLQGIVENEDSPSIAPYERAMRELVCQHCQQNPTAGDYCAERTTMQCPLAHYTREVIDAVESVVRH